MPPNARHNAPAIAMVIGIGVMGTCLATFPGCASLTSPGGWLPRQTIRFFMPDEGSRESRIETTDAPAKGVVVAAHPLASEAGIAVMAAGGNAIDAAIAASFVISVVRPQSTGIGGGGFLLSHNAAASQTEAFDFRERAPARATIEKYRDLPASSTVDGPLSVATPGLVAGLAEVHKSSGKLSWKELLQPAIRIARDGFTVYPQLATALQERSAVLRKYPESTRVFFRDGRPLQLGETLVQTDLAATLTRIAANGAMEFRNGQTARRIVDAVTKAGGILQESDMLHYRVMKRVPVTGQFAGHKIVSMPPPSSGGVHVIEILNILRNDLDSIERSGFASTTHWHLMAEAMRRAFADRASFMGDPDFVTVPVNRLLGLEHADKWRSTINPLKSTPSATLEISNPAASHESDSTTHISVLDPEGNAVATTQTVNFTFGSCIVAGGTGVVLNDEMDDFARPGAKPNAFGLIGNAANAVAPGKTPLSSMTPTIVFDPAGKVRMIAGSPGGPRIISATLQTIFNHIALKMPPADAVHAPRIHHQWIPDKLFIETKWAPESTVSELARMGHEIEPADRIGDVQAIFIEKNVKGQVSRTGVSDTRSEGRARVMH
jgi:gamma-glutamyltranspeptidase/glutathione hydrolase